ncbi:oligosaccharide flippase family protein [Cohnella boryungensis]|uniref:Oligosaccharide flippase family protein n=1 Tax=Cohnella boryungensis TaxID=768479 RepID=A0ABV8S5J9_9BACL
MAASLRGQVMKGGAYLVARRMAGFAISFGGMLLLMHLIGIRNYGMYATLNGLILFLTELCANGMNAYLVREERADKRLYDLVFTAILVSAAIAVALGACASSLLAEWLHDESFRWPFLLALLGLPATAFLVPALAILERKLDFRGIAFVEMYTQVAYYGAAIALAYWQFGLWAPIIGNLVQALTALALGYRFTGYRPSLSWCRLTFKKMLAYGISHSLSKRIISLRALVNPLLVGRFVGPEGVACIALAVRVIEALSLVNGAIQRISFAAFSKISQSKEAVQNTLNELMPLQIFSVVPFLIGFSVVSQWLVPLLFGDDWTTVLHLYPYIAVSFLISCLFSMHVNVLYVRGDNWSVVKFNALHVVLFVAVACALLPIVGLYGYAIAEIVTLATYYAIHLPLRKQYRLRYRTALIYASVCAPALFFPTVPIPWAFLLLAPLLVLVVWAEPRIRLRGYVRQIRSLRAGDAS